MTRMKTKRKTENLTMDWTHARTFFNQYNQYNQSELYMYHQMTDMYKVCIHIHLAV